MYIRRETTPGSHCIQEQSRTTYSSGTSSASAGSHPQGQATGRIPQQCVVMTDNNSQPKKTQGRRKIPIKAIENQSKKLITLSKRRHGLMNKASELSILCGAEVAFISTNVAHNKVFGFGHPSVDSVLDRYINRNFNTESQAENNDRIQILKEEYKERLKILEEEEKRLAIVEEQNKRNESMNNGFWWEWDEPVDDMELEELECYKLRLTQLKNKVVQRKMELIAPASPYISNNLLAGGSSSGIP